MTTPPAPMGDEMLSAYLDGELDAIQRAEVEMALACDPTLAARLARFRDTNAALREDLEAPDPSETPGYLLQAIRDLAAQQINAQGEQETPSGDANVIAFPAAPRPVAQRSAAWRMPLAAAFAFVAGAVSFWAMGQLGPSSGTQIAALDDTGRITAYSALHSALERQPSGEASVTSRTDQIKPILTFRAKDGRFCREFEAARPVGASVGVACRSDGAWRLEFMVAAKAQAAPDGHYVPASGYNQQALDLTVQSLMDGNALNAEDETSLLKKGWAGR